MCSQWPRVRHRASDSAASWTPGSVAEPPGPFLGSGARRGRSLSPEKDLAPRRSHSLKGFSSPGSEAWARLIVSPKEDSYDLAPHAALSSPTHAGPAPPRQAHPGARVPCVRRSAALWVPAGPHRQAQAPGGPAPAPPLHSTAPVFGAPVCPPKPGGISWGSSSEARPAPPSLGLPSSSSPFPGRQPRPSPEPRGEPPSLPPPRALRLDVGQAGGSRALLPRGEQ